MGARLAINYPTRRWLALPSGAHTTPRAPSRLKTKGLKAGGNVTAAWRPEAGPKAALLLRVLWHNPHIDTRHSGEPCVEGQERTAEGLGQGHVGGGVGRQVLAKLPDAGKEGIPTRTREGPSRLACPQEKLHHRRGVYDQHGIASLTGRSSPPGP